MKRSDTQSSSKKQINITNLMKFPLVELIKVYQSISKHTRPTEITGIVRHKENCH